MSDAAGAKRTGSIQLRPYTLHKAPPDWSDVSIHTCTFLTYDIKDVNVETITRMDPIPTVLSTGSIQVAQHPFDKGSVRLAYWGRRLRIEKKDVGAEDFVMDVPADQKSKFTKATQSVFKEYVSLPTIESLDSARYMVDMETQSVAAKLATIFNKQLKRTQSASPTKLTFLVAKVMRIEDGCNPDGSKKFRFMASEREFNEGARMVKYTNNYKFVRATDDPTIAQHTELAIAFSHFTHDHTQGYLVVVDVQGVDVHESNTLVLTDPAIHSAKHQRFGVTNLRQAGIDAFFATHKCNKYCKALGLTMPH